MANPDWDQFQVGATIQPLPAYAPSGNSLLRDADPAIFFVLDFLTYVIRTYPGPRLMQAAAAADYAAFTDAVISARPYQPLPQYLDDQIQFPALFVYRTRGATEEWTIAREHDLCGIEVVYALPPGDAAYAEQIQPILKAVYDSVRAKTAMGWDPGYTPPGGNEGDVAWSTRFANIEEIGFGTPKDKRAAGISTGFEYGSLAGTQDNYFPAIIMRGYVIERDELNPTRSGLQPFSGLDLTGNIQSDDGTVVPATSSTVSQARGNSPIGPCLVPFEIDGPGSIEQQSTASLAGVVILRFTVVIEEPFPAGTTCTIGNALNPNLLTQYGSIDLTQSPGFSYIYDVPSVSWGSESLPALVTFGVAPSSGSAVVTLVFGFPVSPTV